MNLFSANTEAALLNQRNGVSNQNSNQSGGTFSSAGSNGTFNSTTTTSTQTTQNGSATITLTTTTRVNVTTVGQNGFQSSGNSSSSSFSGFIFTSFS